MLKKITSYFRKPDKPFPNTKHIIKYAFTVGGIDYYEFDTTANLPFRRGLKFLSIYNEMDMKIDKYYMGKHIEAVDKLLSGKIALEQLSAIKQLNNQLKERNNFIIPEDLIYKIASVVFFDANENPDDWEWKYASEKIERWKKSESATTFFLHEPIVRLMPFLNVSEENLKVHLEVEKAIDAGHLGNILEMLSPDQKGNFPNFTERYFSREMKASSVQ